MAVGSATGDGVRLGLTEVESVSADDTIRHVDQLSDAAFDRFVRLADGGETVVQLPGESAFEDGEIVVHTAYYRVGLR